MMKKTLLSTNIAVILSLASATAFAEMEDWEKELGDLSNLSDDFEILNLDDSEGFENLSLDFDSDTVETAAIDKVNSMKNEVVLENSSKKSETGVVETNVTVSEIKADKNVMVDETDFIFLRNIPEGTRLVVQSSYKVLPKKRFIILSDGERRLQSPQTMENLEAQFCFFELINSGKARILKKGTPLVVTSNKTEVKEFELNKSYGNYILRTHQTVFNIDNKNVKNFTCYSASKYQKGVDKSPKPLTLKDLKETTGEIFKISFPAYEEL